MLQRLFAFLALMACMIVATLPSLAQDCETYTCPVSGDNGGKQRPAPVISSSPRTQTEGLIVLDFSGLLNLEAILNYYNGGHGGLASGPGPNYGVVFSSTGLVAIDQDAGGGGNFANEPSPDATMFFLTGSAAIMNVAGGFTTGFSFYYTTKNTGQAVVYDGLDGTGNMLAQVSLFPVDFTGCSGDPTGEYCNFVPVGVSFPGTARSVVFGGVDNLIGFDDITLGYEKPNPPDGDNDGIPDEVDNCLTVPNADQMDTDGDGMGDVCDSDDDNDGVFDGNDTDPLNPHICRDDDNDGCDDCAIGRDGFGPLSDYMPNNDGTDTDGDGLCNTGDVDDDSDGCADYEDPYPLVYAPDTDGDGRYGNDCDPDDDNDGVPDGQDTDPLDPYVCQDADNDGCDDCYLGVDQFGPLADNTPNNDGTDTDGDGLCNSGDPDDDNDGCADGSDPNRLVWSPDTDGDGLGNDCDADDDNDGVADGQDTDPLDPRICRDDDNDGCDDCAIGTDGFGSLADNMPNNDGTDTDGDGLCNYGDPDDDNDGCLDADDDQPLVYSPDTDGDGLHNDCDTDDDNDGVDDGQDTDPLDPDICQDADGDGCDDCVVGTDGFGPLADNTPDNDGTDTDGDGLCDIGDPDDDNDGVDDGQDTDPLNPDICQDADNDECDDCIVGTDDFGPLADNTPNNDGIDTDGDGLCDIGDPDDDNDGCLDADDENPLIYSPDPDGDFLHNDCDNCSLVANHDQLDTDGDGEADACEEPVFAGVEQEQYQCLNQSPCFPDILFYDEFGVSLGLDDGWYRLDARIWETCFTDCPGTSWPDAGWCLPEANFFSLPDGHHTIFFKASDDDGNVQGWRGKCKWNFIKDTAPPVGPTEVASPDVVPSGWSNESEVCLTWTDAVDAPEGCTLEGYSILLDGKPASIPEADMGLNFVPAGVEAYCQVMPEGEHQYVHFRGVDAAGNWQGESGIVHYGPLHIDRTPPFVTIDCGDEIDSPEKLCFYFDGSDNFTPSEKLRFSYMRVGVDEDFSEFEAIDHVCWEYIYDQGLHTLRVRARDLAGNVGPAAQCVFRYEPHCDLSIKGDPSYDCDIDVIDVINVAMIILGWDRPDEAEFWRADCNGDDVVNVIDAVNIVNIILGFIAECPADGGSTRPAVTPEVLEFLQGLEPYFSDTDFADLMVMVKALQVPDAYGLEQNYPNPFNPTTSIQYSVAGDQTTQHSPLITLKIYNLLGQEVATLVDEVQEPGYYAVTWDGKDQSGVRVSSGVYFCRMRANDYTTTRRMVLMK